MYLHLVPQWPCQTGTLFPAILCPWLLLSRLAQLLVLWFPSVSCHSNCGCWEGGGSGRSCGRQGEGVTFQNNPRGETGGHFEADSHHHAASRKPPEAEQRRGF